MSGNLRFPARLRAVAVCFAAVLALAACGDQRKNEVKGIREQVLRAVGTKKYAEQLQLSQKGLALAREVMGDKEADTLYFAQSITEAHLAMRNFRAAIPAMKNELAMRSAAGQAESRLQKRRVVLIKLAEDSGDKATAAEQAVAVSRGIGMGPGKTPEPVYQFAAYYPAQPYQQKVQGDVEISFSLDATGAVTGARVARSTPSGVFDDAALEAFRKWRYTPMLDSTGQPVSASGFSYTMAFRVN